jgi:hypothetical protein
MNTDELTGKLKCLLEEFTANQNHAAQQYDVGGKAKKLETRAWDAVKEEIEGLGEDLAVVLQSAYSQVWRFNYIAENYDRIWDPLPNGDTLESLVSDNAIRAKIALIRAVGKLSAYLAE